MPSKPSKKSSKRRENKQVNPPKKKEGLSTPAKVVIVIFAVLMVFSMMVPSLSAIVNGGSSSTSTMTVDEIKESLNSTYSSEVEDLEAKLEDDPSDTDTILQLANDYLSWAANLSYYSSTDDETLQVYDYAEKAAGYFDQYLESNPDDSEARTSRAMSEYYAGNTAEAVSELEAITEDDPSYASAWANLGLMYEVQGDTDAALEAYQTAEEKDPDDEEGVYSYAEGRIEAINSSESSVYTTTGDLQQDLENATGVSAE